MENLKLLSPQCVTVLLGLVIDTGKHRCTQRVEVWQTQDTELYTEWREGRARAASWQVVSTRALSDATAFHLQPSAHRRQSKHGPDPQSDRWRHPIQRHFPCSKRLALLIFLDGCCACVYSVCSKLFNCGKYLFSSDISDWAHQDSEVTPESQCWEIPTPAAVLMRWILIKVGFDWNPTTSWSLPHLVFPQRAHIWRAAGTTYHPNYSSQPLNLLFMPSLSGVSSFGPQIYEFKLFYVVKWSLKWQ